MRRPGASLWERRLPSPDFGCATVSNDVVFTSTYDGSVYAFAVDDGTLVWHERMRAGMNACPAVVGDLVLFGAGVRLRRTRRSSWRSACSEALVPDDLELVRRHEDLVPFSRSVTR